MRPTFAAWLVTLEFERLTSKGREKIRARPTTRKGIPSRNDQRNSFSTSSLLPSVPIFLFHLSYSRKRSNVGQYVHLHTRLISPPASFTFSSLRLNACRLARAVIYCREFIPGVPPLQHQCLHDSENFRTLVVAENKNSLEQDALFTLTVSFSSSRSTVLIEF